MAELRDRIYHRRTSVVSKRPELFDIDDGELAINYNADDPGLYFKDISSDGTRRIRKIGPIHYGPLAPNYYASANGYYADLSDGECWIDTALGSEDYIFKVWDKESLEWIEISSQKSANIDYSLDQFRDWEDGDNFIHTDGINLKINNKITLAGQSTEDGNKLFINPDNEFTTSVELSGSYIFKTDGNASSVSETLIKTVVVPSSSFTPYTIESFSSNYRSAKYIIQMEVDKPSPKIYQIKEVLAIHDGSDAFLTEYGEINTSDQYLGELDLTISNNGQQVILTFKKDASISFPINIKILRTSILV